MEQFEDMIVDLKFWENEYKKLKKDNSHLIYLKASGKGDSQTEDNIENIRKKMVDVLFKIESIKEKINDVQVELIKKEMDGNEDDRYKTNKRK